MAQVIVNNDTFYDKTCEVDINGTSLQVARDNYHTMLLSSIESSIESGGIDTMFAELEDFAVNLATAYELGIGNSRQLHRWIGAMQSRLDVVSSYIPQHRLKRGFNGTVKLDEEPRTENRRTADETNLGSHAAYSNVNQREEEITIPEEHDEGPACFTELPYTTDGVSKPREDVGELTKHNINRDRYHMSWVVGDDTLRIGNQKRAINRFQYDGLHIRTQIGDYQPHWTIGTYTDEQYSHNCLTMVPLQDILKIGIVAFIRSEQGNFVGLLTNLTNTEVWFRPIYSLVSNGDLRLSNTVLQHDYDAVTGVVEPFEFNLEINLN